MISNAQKAILHVAKAKLHLEDDFYRSILRENAGVESSTDLTNKGFDKVMKRLEQLGFYNTARRRKGRPLDSITPEQLAHIRDLYGQLGWSEQSRQMGFNKRCCRRSWPQSKSDGIKVIEGLKAMLSRQGSTK